MKPANRVAAVSSFGILGLFANQVFAQEVSRPDTDAGSSIAGKGEVAKAADSSSWVAPAGNANDSNAPVAKNASQTERIQPTVASPATELNASRDTASAKGKKSKEGRKGKRGRKVAAEQAASSADEQPTVEGELVADAVAGDPWGNTKGALRASGLTFRFLVQAQYQHTLGVDSQNADTTYRLPENTLARNDDGWDITRVFFGITAEPSKYLHLKVLTDFAEFKKSKSSRAVKQAFAELRPIPKHIHFAVGILKLPYSIHELDSITAYEFTSSGRTNSLLNKMDIAGRDIGAEVIVSPLARPRYLKLTLGAYRGHAHDENATPVGSIGTRVETEPSNGLRLGTGMMIQPKDTVQLNALDTSGDTLLPNPSNPDFPRAETWKKGNAFGLDVTYRRQGFMARGEALTGTRVDYDTRFGADRWGAAWGIIGYTFGAGPVKLEPAIRVEYLDTNFKRAGGLYRQYTFAIGIHFNATTKLIFDVTRMEVESNTPYIDQPQPLRAVPFQAIDATCITGRLQVAL